MQNEDSTRPGNTVLKGHFTTTHWSLVLAAGLGSTTRSQSALAKLCQIYWYPLYAYVRRQGYNPHDAQDLTQEFFARLLKRSDLSKVDQSKGKFRSFLLASMKHFLANEYDRNQAQKRGGGEAIVSLDVQDAENRYILEPADQVTAEDIFERRWALTVLDEVLKKLSAEYEAAGKKNLFDILKTCLTGEKNSLPYAELAEQLKISESAIKVTAHRLRRRYRALLYAEIADTVENPAEVETELRYLRAVLNK